MSCQADAQKEITTFAAPCSCFALAGQPDALSLVHATRDLDLIIFNFVRTGTAQRNSSGRAVESFFQRDHDIGFHIAAALRSCLTSTESAESGSPATTTEKSLKEIAESRAAKFKLDTTVPTSVAIKSAIRLLRSPSRRRLKPAWLIPIRTELIVFFPLLRIAQNFVCLVDLFELFLGRRFVFRDIRMMFPRQLAKGGANLIVACRFWNAECFVIISKLNRHRPESLRMAYAAQPWPPISARKF